MEKILRDKYISLVDGTCSNNGLYNAKSGGSYAIFKVPNNEITPSIIDLKDPIIFNHRFEFNKFEGEKVSTNNAAECLSMYSLLLELVDKDILNPNNYNIIYSDSSLIINQLKLLYKINNPQLKKMHAKIQELFKQYRLRHGHIIAEDMKIQHCSGDVLKLSILKH